MARDGPTSPAASYQSDSGFEDAPTLNGPLRRQTQTAPRAPTVRMCVSQRWALRTPHVEHSLRATHSKVPRQEMDQSWTAVSWQKFCEMFYQICHSSQAMCPIRFSLSSDVRYALACRQGEFDPTSFSNHRVQLLNQVESKSPSRQAKAYRHLLDAFQLAQFQSGDEVCCPTVLPSTVSGKCVFCCSHHPHDAPPI